MHAPLLPASVMAHTSAKMEHPITVGTAQALPQHCLPRDRASY